MSTRELPTITKSSRQSHESLQPIYLDLGPLANIDETKSRESLKENASILDVPRGAEVSGAIARAQ